MFEKIDSFKEFIASKTQDVRKNSDKKYIHAFFINIQRKIEGLKEISLWLKTHLGHKRPLKSKKKLRVSHWHGKKYVLSESDFWEDGIDASEKTHVDNLAPLNENIYDDNNIKQQKASGIENNELSVGKQGGCFGDYDSANGAKCITCTQRLPCAQSTAQERV